MRIAAGALMITGGLGALVGASVATAVMFKFGFLSIPLVALLSALALASMIVSFIGAYCIFRRRRFRLALACGISCAAAFPFIPGLLATIFVTAREGESQGRGRPETAGEKIGSQP